MKIMRAAHAAAAEVKFRIGGRQRDWDHPGAVLQLKLEVLNFLFLEKKSWLGLIEAQVFGLIIIITVKHLRREWYLIPVRTLAQLNIALGLRNYKLSLQKVAQAGSRPGIFLVFIYFLSQMRRLRPLGYCAPSSYRMFVTTITSISNSVLNLEIGMVEGRTLGYVKRDAAFQWRANTDKQMYNKTPITRLFYIIFPASFWIYFSFFLEHC